jgi:hypothetical protein
MNRRVFTTRVALTVAGIGLTTTAFKCGSDKVSIYVTTIVSFLKEISALVPAQAAFISRAIAVAGDFDAAYRRGDFANASTFFNTLVGNVQALATNLGAGLSPRIQTVLSVVSITIRTVAVLLVNEGATKVGAVVAARASNPAMDAAASTIERLANPKSVNAAFEAAKL